MPKSLLNKAEVKRMAFLACHRRYEHMTPLWKKCYMPTRIGKKFYDRLEYVTLCALLAEVNNRPSKGLTL